MALVAAFNRPEAFKVDCPAGTAIASPLQTDVSFNPGQVVGLEIIIPNGHAGFTGIQIAQAHTPVIPFSDGSFLIGNGEKIEWNLVGLTDTGSFQTFTYNTDAFNHSWYVRFLVSDFPAGGAGSIIPNPLNLTF